MTLEKLPTRVKLICGIISIDHELLDEVSRKLAVEYGSVDIVSKVMDFDFTNYYEPEMGTGLYRGFLSFEQLILPDTLASVKRLTNQLESSLRSGTSQRPVNIDPGYITTAKLVLASMKDFSHRLCLDQGVYGEITMTYHKGWVVLPWTFPDYGSGRYDTFLNKVRTRYAEQIKEPLNQ